MQTTDKSVKSAADKILGLLNPQPEAPKEPKQETGQSETNVTAEPSVEPVEEQVTSQESQSASEEAQVDVDATENMEVKEETASEVEVEKPNLHRVKVQGQELEVTLDELKAGYSRDSDYRQKTHSLSLERKQIEEEKNVLRQQYDMRIRDLSTAIATAESMMGQQMSPQQLQRLYDEDPATASKVDFQMRQQKDRIRFLKSKLAEEEGNKKNSYLAEQIRLAQERIPEFSDPNKIDSFKSGMKSLLKGYGYNDQEISEVSDHRLLLILKDAMAYNNFKQSKPIIQKKIEKAPKVVKPGVAVSENSQRSIVRNKISKLKKSGRIEDAQSAILGMLTK